MMVVKGYIFSILYAIVCLALGFLFYKAGVEKKITRKIVHILVGFEWVILYHFMGGGIHFLVVCLLFLLLLTIAHFKKLMPMISSDDDNSPGTVYYAVAMSIMAVITLFIPDMILPFGIGVFCTSIGDGFAGIVGQSVISPWNKRIYGKKSILGSATNFALCLGVVFFFKYFFCLPLNIWHCILVAFFALELELFCGKGLDNIAITLGSSLLAYSLINLPWIENYLIPIILTPAIIAFAYKKRALTISGIFSAIFLDIIVSITMANFGFVILLSFFIGGVVVDKIKKHNKKSRQSSIYDLEKRGDVRDHVQVFANGSVGLVCAVLYAVTFKKVFVIAYVASFAEAFADTVASGIGVLSGRAFDVFRMKKCPVGISGGMSLLGTFSSILAALSIGLIALVFGKINFAELIIVASSAFLGAIFDSFLGSIVQVKYRCKKCGLILEKEEHCSQKTEKISGIRLINNDIVNLLSTAFAAIVAILLHFII